LLLPIVPASRMSEMFERYCTMFRWMVK